MPSPYNDPYETKLPHPPVSALQEAVQALAQARLLADDVQELAGQLCGAAPSPERGNAEISPDGLLPMLGDDARRTKHRLDLAQDALSRIRKMV